LLEKPTIAIGRSPGNDIVLDANSVSRYHITITRRGDQTFAEDLESANGTYLDGQRMKPHQPYDLHGVEELLIGDIRLIFQQESAEQADQTGAMAPTSPVTPVSEDYSTKPIPREPLEATRRIEITQPSYKVSLDSAQQTVTPGAHVQVTLTIDNLSDETDRYFIEVDGVPKDWVRVERAELELKSGEQASVIISLKPLRRSDSVPGDYPITIRVRSKANPSQAVEAPLKLVLRTYSGFGIALSTERIDSRTPFKLHVHNQGNGPLSLAFSGASSENDLSFEFHPPAMTLAAGERQVVRGYVRSGRGEIVGRAHERHFALQARSQDPSQFLTAVPGTLIERPMLPVWAATLVIPMLIALVLLGAAGLIVLALARPRTPVITAFSASATSILEGDTVTLSWSVSDASELALKLDGGTPSPIDSGLTSISQVVTGVGQRTFTLVARNGSESAQRDVVITVSQAMKIDSFTVSPNPVLLYVQQKVTISWKADGAASVYLQGVEALTGSPDNNSYPATNQIELSGTPRDALQLTLVAVGADGRQLSQALQVDTANPECQVLASQVEMRSGPGDVYPATGTLTSGAKVSPDGRDQSGGWIHLILTANADAWLPASAVQCDHFEPSKLTPLTVFPPTPLPTPTLTPTLTLTPSASPTQVQPRIETLPPSPTATPMLPSSSPQLPQATATMPASAPSLSTSAPPGNPAIQPTATLAEFKWIVAQVI
jgi:pSer/pThr/pTyr-binding forkhead associated (FHA) protein